LRDGANIVKRPVVAGPRRSEVSAIPVIGRYIAVRPKVGAGKVTAVSAIVLGERA
jgi:hypothetical protein